MWFCEIWQSFSLAPIRNFLWFYYRWLITSLGLEKCKKECNILLIILVQGFCPLRIKITQSPRGFLLNIINEDCNKWSLKICLKKTKALIFQKQNGKSTRAKYTFFLNGNQVANSTEYSYLGIIFNSNGSFSVSKQLSAEKTRRSIFGAKRYLEFNNLPCSCCMQ